MPDRRYSEEEFAELLKAASEIQSRALVRSESSPARPGMTLEEITSIAGEVGLSADSIRQASALIHPTGESASPGDGRFTLHGAFPGALDDEMKLRVLQAARDITHAAGEVEHHPTGVEWRATPEGVFRWQLSVHHVAGRNEWRIVVSRKDAKTLTYMGTISAGLALSLFAAVPVGGVLGWLAVAGGGTVGTIVGRWTDHWAGGRQLHKAQALAKEVARILAAAPPVEAEDG